MKLAKRLKKFEQADLYVVITEAFCADRASLAVLDSVLEAGVKLIQFREKIWEDRRMFRTAEQFRARTAEAGALLIVDDRVDVALGVGADGVHLGQEDIPIDVVRELAPNLLIGASTHSVDEAKEAQECGASYINIGPVFETQTKANAPGGPLGIEGLKSIVKHAELPWSCMGGIKLHNIDQVLDVGARHPAVVTAVTEAMDVAAAAKELRNRVLEHSGSG